MIDTYQENINHLRDKYKKSAITKKELAKELDVSLLTIERRIKAAKGIPRYKRSGDGTKATYIFPIVEVAKFLSSDLIEVA